MQLLEFPIRRYQFTLVAFLCLVAIGWFAFSTIPREEDPFFKSPAFSVPVIYPGADPKEIERLIVKPIEDRIAALDDVYKLETTVVDGVAIIFIQFGVNSDADKKYDEVMREVSVVRANLGSTVANISVRKWSPAYVNIVQFALVSEEAPYSELEDTARDLADALKAVAGVRTAETWAFPKREVRVALDLARMAELKVTPTQVINALQSENAAIPAGFIDMGARSFSLKASDSFNKIDDVRDTVVAVSKGQTTRVKDVAEVRWDNAPLSYIGRYNGKRAVFVTAQQQDNQNILKTNERIATTVAAFQRNNLPARIQLEWGFKQADNVAHRLNSLYRDFGIAVALVAITLLPLGLRAAGIVMIAIPLSLAFGLTVLYFVGYSLNQISIAGFVVALGLLVDDSIVVVENIARHLRQGHSRTQAALLATRQIFEAILGCTATLVFAFLPLLMLPGDAGKFIRVLPTAIIATVMGSLIVALFIIPFLASRLLKEEGSAEGSPLLQKVMAVIHRYYQPALRASLSRPKTTAIVAIGGSLLLSALVIPVLGSSLFPKADTPRFLIGISTPNGSSFAETRRALDFVEAGLSKMPEVKSYFSNLGHGNPQVYYNHIPVEDAANYAEIYVQLHDYDARQTPLMLDALRKQLDRYANARINVREFTNGIPISAPISVRVLGPDLQVLEKLSHQIEALVKATPGTRDVKNPMRVKRTNLRLQADSAKANLLGVPTVEFDRAVRLAVSGISAGKFRDAEGEQYDIMLRAPVGERATLDTLQQTRVSTVTGQNLPLSQLASLQFETAPILIQRFSRQRAVVIDASAERGENVARLTAEVVRKLDQFNWPAGYRYELGGEAASSAESFSGIGTAIIIAIFGIFAILVLEFGSFKSTLIVLTVVPLGVLGGLLMLLMTGNDISFTASIGFIGLIGIEIKNSILLVDFTNQLRREGVPLDEAIERAGEVRFLPILLTSATAIGGLLPLALENTGIYSPLSWVIIGGLITSTLLARLVTPVMYKLLPPEVEMA
ncbi:MAG: efflux RND transporter permease subunit [Steroidobacteraceae bacterium]